MILPVVYRGKRQGRRGDVQVGPKFIMGGAKCSQKKRETFKGRGGVWTNHKKVHDKACHFRRIDVEFEKGVVVSRDQALADPNRMPDVFAVPAGAMQGELRRAQE